MSHLGKTPAAPVSLADSCWSLSGALSSYAGAGGAHNGRPAVIGKPIVPREQANRDVDEALEDYLKEASAKVALGFIDALEKAYSHISPHPASGSTRYSVELNLPGLRSWPVRRVPHIVFYVEATDHVDVWRVLHGTRDIPAWMQEPGRD